MAGVHEQEIAGLKAAAASCAARFEPIDRLVWPAGARIAVNFTADFDAMLLRRLHNEPPMQLAKGEFGGRVGVWRLLELFDSHRIKATFFTPGRICELYPQALRAIAASGHELADHMWEHHVPKDPGLERDHLLKTRAALERIAGRRPVGSRSHHTPTLLRDEGYIYNSHGAPDHRPHYVLDAEGAPCLLELPFHFAIDDAMFFSFAWYASANSEQRLSDPDRVFDMWWAGFLQQYRQGGYLNICLHPFVSGRALRIAMLDRLVARMKTLPGVWFASCEDVARHCLATHPPQRGKPRSRDG
jgi:peptidoglycan-N-acetylglucosamine deacetylase